MVNSQKTKALQVYRTRRNFSATPEPEDRSARIQKKPIFVIQKHNATHLHYDFRLEIGGVLVSWALPKGPTRSSSIKRLAIHTEDHPLSYATFSGVIPEGEYGTGTVKIWDKGIYENMKRKNGRIISMKECLQQGEILIWLHGKKLTGQYALIKTALGSEKKPQWLFIKTRIEKKDKL